MSTHPASQRPESSVGIKTPSQKTPSQKTPPQKMPPRLLVSVRSVGEALHAYRGGASIVDLKEPLKGSLGSVTPETAREVAVCFERLRQGMIPAAGTPCDRATRTMACSLSLAMGELVEWLPSIDRGAAVEPTAFRPASRPSSRPLCDRVVHRPRGTGDSRVPRNFPAELLGCFSFAKIGLAGTRATGWRDAWRAWARSLPLSTAPVLVIYADAKAAGSPTLDAALEFAQQFFVATNVTKEKRHAPSAKGVGPTLQPRGGILVDTWRKDGRNVLDVLDIDALRRVVTVADQLGVWSAIAGSVDLGILAPVVSVHPDVIGVRGAVCAGDRTDAVDFGRVRRLSDRLSQTVRDSRLASRGGSI